MTKTMTPQEYLEYLPDEYVGIAMEADGRWFAMKHKATLTDCGWNIRGSNYEMLRMISIEYSGNWKDSWTPRKLTFGDLEVGCEFKVSGLGLCKKVTNGAAIKLEHHGIHLCLEVTLND